MQTPITKQEMQELEALASLTTIFDMPSSKLEAPQFGVVSGPSGMAHHSRSISAESGSSSLTGTDYPMDYNESQGYNFRRINPEGHVVQRPSAPLARRQNTVTPYRTVVPPRHVRHRRRPATSDEEDEFDEEEELEPLSENATAAERKEYKKKLNTLAARRSRKRKAEILRRLEDDVNRLNRERDIWRERAMMLVGMLVENHLPCPQFDIHGNIVGQSA
ncbi:hypothetical protein JR316_0000110 [Psilocybe cubensis]|uniref:Uncharacterized protein n=2 Tax=Psilocybe cubensis TaxID=181762 RepID=A0ACB8HDU4_PSICU|nr:hypothetical protein JR316_0000110 [Psilocybe cubensis]KAH9486046.1 hypothetical protein JR316_0000110 [Psilocybe cubensis]